MNVKVYSTIELVLAVCFTILGGVVIGRITSFEGYVQYVMVGFVVAKMALIATRSFAYSLNKPFMWVQLGLNALIIILLFVFKQADSLSFVISASCFVDLALNLAQSFVFKKTNPTFRTSFFGMENVIYLIFVITLIFNKDSNLLATGVFFGTIILYKGISLVLGNDYIQGLIGFTDFGKAIVHIHGLDVLFGLVIIIVLTSCLFPYLEPDVFSNGEDALWYCFMLVTTIGTGDFVATTRLGRILSAIIGCYGIVIVSILTSAIVVYINKMQDKSKAVAAIAKQEETKVEEKPAVEKEEKKPEEKKPEPKKATARKAAEKKPAKKAKEVSAPKKAATPKKEAKKPSPKKKP